MNDKSTSYETCSSFFCKDGNAFIISGNFRQSLSLYLLNANDLRYSSSTFVASYLAVPVWSTLGLIFYFSTVISSRSFNLWILAVAYKPCWLIGLWSHFVIARMIFEVLVLEGSRSFQILLCQISWSLICSSLYTFIKHAL